MRIGWAQSPSTPMLAGHRPARGRNGRHPRGGHCYELAPGQLERARLLKALLRKGVSLARLAAADLAFDAAKPTSSMTAVSCTPAGTPQRRLATVVRAKHSCLAVDLSAIRTGAEE
jgi:hypothetical protein